jgi:type IV pilus assembly protein PilF
MATLCACASEQKVDNTEAKAILHHQLGNSYFVKGAYPQALREMLEATRLRPNDPAILNNLGLVYLALGKHDDAEKAYLKALDFKPDYTDARNNLGRLYIEAGLTDKAIVELERAASDLTYEQPEKSFGNLGQAYFYKGDFTKAKQAFQKSLKNRRESCFTMNFYGRSLFELQNYKEATEALDQAIRLCEKSKFEEPHFYSALSFYKLNQHEQSRARLTELLSLFPGGRYAQKSKELLEILK